MLTSRRLRRERAGADVSDAQYSVLAVLDRGGPATLRALADHLQQRLAWALEASSALAEYATAAGEVVEQVREWRGRMGGTLYGMWPSAASALTGLRRRLPLFPGYLVRAREIADAVWELPGVTVVPDPPQTPMLHLLLRTTPEAFTAAARQLAERRSLWTWREPMTTPDPSVVRVELSVGDATMALDVAEVRDAVAVLAGGPSGPGAS